MHHVDCILTNYKQPTLSLREQPAHTFSTVTLPLVHLLSFALGSYPLPSTPEQPQRCNARGELAWQNEKPTVVLSPSTLQHIVLLLFKLGTRLCGPKKSLLVGGEQSKLGNSYRLPRGLNRHESLATERGRLLAAIYDIGSFLPFSASVTLPVTHL